MEKGIEYCKDIFYKCNIYLVKIDNVKVLCWLFCQGINDLLEIITFSFATSL